MFASHYFFFWTILNPERVSRRFFYCSVPIYSTHIYVYSRHVSSSPDYEYIITRCVWGFVSPIISLSLSPFHSLCIQISIKQMTENSMPPNHTCTHTRAHTNELYIIVIMSTCVEWKKRWFIGSFCFVTFSFRRRVNTYQSLFVCVRSYLLRVFFFSYFSACACVCVFVVRTGPPQAIARATGDDPSVYIIIVMLWQRPRPLYTMLISYVRAYSRSPSYRVIYYVYKSHLNGFFFSNARNNNRSRRCPRIRKTSFRRHATFQ